MAPVPTSAVLSPVREASTVRKSAGMNGLVTGTISRLAMRPPAATRGEVASPAVRFWPGAVVVMVEIGVGASAAADSYCVQPNCENTSMPLSHS